MDFFHLLNNHHLEILPHSEHTGEDITDLENAAHHYLSLGKDIGEITIADFPLNSFSSHLQQLSENYYMEPGLRSCVVYLLKIIPRSLQQLYFVASVRILVVPDHKMHKVIFSDTYEILVPALTIKMPEFIKLLNAKHFIQTAQTLLV